MGEVLDCRGLACPKPVLKVAIQARKMKVGSTLEVLADCPSFENDIRKWCEDMGKVLVSVVKTGSHEVATIRL